MVSVGGCFFLPATTREKWRNERHSQVTTENTNDHNLPVTTPASEENSNFIVKVVQKVGHGVVRINTYKKVTPRPFLGGYFGNYELSQPRERVEEGSGSGFIKKAER